MKRETDPRVKTLTFPTRAVLINNKNILLYCQRHFDGIHRRYT